LPSGIAQVGQSDGHVAPERLVLNAQTPPQDVHKVDVEQGLGYAVLEAAQADQLLGDEAPQVASSHSTIRLGFLNTKMVDRSSANRLE
jgi:hypothetical protein